MHMWAHSASCRPVLVAVQQSLPASLRAWHLLHRQQWGRGLRQAAAAAAGVAEDHAAAGGGGEAAAPAPAHRPHHPHAHGSIELLLGPMFAGKSSELLRRVAAAEARGLRVAVLKSSRDGRYSDSAVVTHDGVQRVRLRE